MSSTTIDTQSLVIKPQALPPAKGFAVQSPKRAPTVPAAAVNGTLPSSLIQSLEALGNLTGAGDAPGTSSFQSAVQANADLTSLLKSPVLPDSTPTPLAQDPTSLTPLLLQALTAEDLPSSSGEIPFITPYQLGLQAFKALTPPIPTPDQANLAQPSADLPDAEQIQNSTASISPDPLQTLNPLNTLVGSTDAPSLGIADPTSSALFQSHLGALGANPLLALASLNSGLTETPTTLRVMATNAGAATGAFSQGQALNPNSYVLNSAAREGLSPNPSPSAMSVEGVPAIYSPQGIPMAYRTRIGALLDLRG